MFSYDNKLLTIDEAAEYLRVSKRCIYNQIFAYKKDKTRGMPDYCYKKIGKTLLFIPTRLDQFILGTPTTENNNSQDVA